MKNGEDRLDGDFYRRREQQERSMAQRCVDPEVAAIHKGMADRYAKLAAAILEPRTAMPLSQ